MYTKSEEATKELEVIDLAALITPYFTDEENYLYQELCEICGDDQRAKEIVLVSIKHLRKAGQEAFDAIQKLHDEDLVHALRNRHPWKFSDKMGLKIQEIASFLGDCKSCLEAMGLAVSQATNTDKSQKQSFGFLFNDVLMDRVIAIEQSGNTCKHLNTINESLGRANKNSTNATDAINELINKLPELRGHLRQVVIVAPEEEEVEMESIPN